MYKRIALKGVLKFTLKQLQTVSVQLPSSGMMMMIMMTTVRFRTVRLTYTSKHLKTYAATPPD
jgi:redox-regulated HSP33 family molecular chaperone